MPTSSSPRSKVIPSESRTGAGARPSSRFCFLLTVTLALAGAGCSILHTRPVQEMSDTQAALRAAREVQADTLAPELYRQANEWFFRARHEYKLKNFKLAEEYANKARLFAEQAEFESIRNGATRTESSVPDPLAHSPPPAERAPAPKPYDYPTPTGTPFDPNKDPANSPATPPTTGTAPTPAPGP